MGKRMLLALVCCGAFAAGVALAQEATGVIEGVVAVKGTREPLARVELSLPEIAQSVTTDDAGRFRFAAVPAGTYTLVAQGETIGAQSLEVTVKPGQTVVTRLYVKRNSYVLDEVTVVGEREPEAVSRQELDKQELTGVPGANNDPIRVLENLPGVAATSVMGFGSEGLVIRGVSEENSGYKLNGLDIPQLFHFGGLNSIVNAELLRDIVYYPGAYSVKYGDALGGIVELTNREPRADRFGAIVDLNTYATFAIFEGPIGENASWAVGARRSFIDFLMPAVIPKDEASFTVLPRFYDYQAMFNYRLGGAHQFEFFAFGSDDAMAIVEAQPEAEDPFNSDTFKARLFWHQPGFAWTWTPTASVRNYFAANYTYANQEFYFGPDYRIDFKINQVLYRDDLSLKLDGWNELHVGVDGGYTYADLSANVPRPPKEGDPGFEDTAEDTFRIGVADDAAYGAVYLEDVMTPVEWLTLTPGIRANYMSYLNDATADPRISAKVRPIAPLALKAATGVYHQWPQIDEFLKGFGNPDVEAEMAMLYSAGAEYDFGAGWSIDVQGYYKQLTNMVSPGREGEPVYTNDGQGRIYGAELLTRKKLTDRLMGWLSYTYSVSRRKDNADADWRFFDQDQTHNFVILASYLLGEAKDWRLGAKWQITSGLPYTKIDGAIYDADTDSYLPVYSDEINGEREAPFHRLDLRVDKLWTFDAWQLNTYLDLQNVYWSKYPVGYEYNFDYSKKRPVSFPAFMPTLGLQGRF